MQAWVSMSINVIGTKILQFISQIPHFFEIAITPDYCRCPNLRGVITKMIRPGLLVITVIRLRCATGFIRRFRFPLLVLLSLLLGHRGLIIRVLFESFEQILHNRILLLCNAFLCPYQELPHRLRSEAGMSAGLVAYRFESNCLKKHVPNVWSQNQKLK